MNVDVKDRNGIAQTRMRGNLSQILDFSAKYITLFSALICPSKVLDVILLIFSVHYDVTSTLDLAEFVVI